MSGKLVKGIFLFLPKIKKNIKTKPKIRFFLQKRQIRFYFDVITCYHM